MSFICRFTQYFFVFLFLLFYFVDNDKCVAEEIDYKDAIVIIKSLEKQISLLKWVCEKNEGKFTDTKNDKEIFTANNQYNKSMVIYDVAKQKYNVLIESTVPWIDGKDAFLSKRKSVAFDGTFYYEWVQSVPGKKLPDTKIQGNAIVTKDISESYENKLFADAGKVYCGFDVGIPLLFYNNCTTSSLKGPALLSEFIEIWKKENNLISIEKDEDNKLIIRTKTFLNTSQAILTLDYDTLKGGIVTQVKYTYLGHNGQEIEDCSYNVIVEKNSRGQWIPKQVIMKLFGDHIMIVTNFIEFEINPILEKDCFVFKFPNGSIVEDFITKKYYKIGDIENEDKAIGDFMMRNNLTGTEVYIPSKRSTYVRYMLMLIGVTFIIVAIYLRWKKSVK